MNREDLDLARQAAGTEPATPHDATRERQRAHFARSYLARLLATRLKALRRRRVVLLAVALVPLALLLIPAVWLVHRVYFDRSDLPDLESFIRFEPPTTGVVRDAQGRVLIELAHQYRRVVSYDEVPLILRQAILAAEDKRFFSHSGVDYRALPRVARKTVARSLAEWRKGDEGLRLLLPQGGSTLTQQLVRGYFLQELTSRSDGDALFRSGLAPPRLLSVVLGASAMNKLLRKMEEARLTLWLEQEMRRRYGSRQRAKREIFARYASFIYLGNGRYGFAAASEYYFAKPLSSYGPDDAGHAALLAAIGKSPRDYAPELGNQRLLDRRNQILALMARNGYIPQDLAKRCQGEPIRVARRSPTKTDAPAAIEHVLDELTRHGGSVEDLFQGRISVHATVDARVQAIVNEALEHGLALYEKRHPEAKGLIQGSVVVLGNADAAILAEAGGRRVYGDRDTRYSDYNRVTGSLRQPGSAMKPLVYLAAFESGMGLDTQVPDEPIAVPLGGGRGTKQIANYDNQFKGPIPMRQALAESRNAVAVWITREIGVRKVIRTAHQMGIRTPLQPYLSTALGASEVRLLELADAYRAIASGVLAEPHIIDRVIDLSGDALDMPPRRETAIRSAALHSLQEGLRGVVRLPNGTARSLNSRDFPIPVMGKTGTTSNFRDALFVGSTYGTTGITVAVRIGFDDNRPLGQRETGGRTALPVFREIMLRVYQDQLVGPVPRFPRKIEDGIDRYLARQSVPEVSVAEGWFLPTSRPRSRVVSALPGRVANQ
ncbi:MAG TPA: transglycosylase domain-containing protein [Thermoanaerobaculia bacterium]|nr:transglycosylase domain-containing protein [Thermoanaerobaculia bacterium]